MPKPTPFREAKPLGHFIEHLAELPRWSWLYIAVTEPDITLDTACHPTATDSRDMSEEEIQEFEAYTELSGLRSFFYRDQLRDIIENLRLQRSDFTPQQLATAIDFYWKHDAFIDFSTHAAEPCDAANGGIASLLQPGRLVAAVAELGSLGTKCTE